MDITRFFCYGRNGSRTDGGNTLTFDKLTQCDQHMNVTDTHFLFPEPESQLSEWLLKLLEDFKVQVMANESCDADLKVFVASRHVAECCVELRYRNGRVACDIWARIEQYSLPDTVELQLPGVPLTVDVSEHWLVFRRGRRSGVSVVRLAHTKMHPHFDSESHLPVGAMKGSHQMYKGVKIQAQQQRPGRYMTLWKRLFHFRKWQQEFRRPASPAAAAENSETGPLPIMDATLASTDLREDMDRKMYLVPTELRTQGDDRQYEIAANFIVCEVLEIIKWNDEKEESKSGCTVRIEYDDGSARAKSYEVLLLPDAMNSPTSFEAHMKNNVHMGIFCRALKMKHLQHILQPMMTEWTNRNDVKTALTVMGRQATSIDELKDNHDFVFGNCVVQSGGCYEDTLGLRHSKYRMVIKIFNEVSKKCFGRAAFPKLKLIRDPVKRREFAVHWYNASQTFHINNICAALWSQAMMWASLSFLEWIQMDRCFPITYILSTQHGIGKTTTMHALAASIGLPAEVITGNKSSESGEPTDPLKIPHEISEAATQVT